MEEKMIIGVAGTAFSGKDTFAKMLAEELNKLQHPAYVLMAYANEMKLRIQKDFDLSYDQLWGDKKEYTDLRYAKRGQGYSSNPGDYWTPREIMQAYGEFYRTIDYDFWVKNLFRVIEDKEYTNVIITDVRHINEADAVKEHSGFLIKIIRENKMTPHGANHISETALNDYKGYDFTIINNFSLDELKISTQGLITFLKRSIPELKNNSEKIAKVSL
jgi:hypothetical protein